MPALNLYEADFYAWTQEQAMVLRSKQQLLLQPD
ncbi:DUF29 family protein [Leptolyngbya sp. 'hensonii']|nr:DUF29 family protein [Leptolyngbya sp. 'hensonii']